MESNYNIYLGMVVQNNDPEMRGRVKVYIPQLAPTIQKLNSNENINTDKFFAFIGNDTNPQITTILEDIKSLLPWAEYAGPMFGGNASGRYNATTEKGTTSDSNAWDKDNVANGFRPAQNYTAQQAYSDAFSANGINSVHQNKFVNQFAYQYTPSNYSGLARGLFTIPNVGAHVYVFFLNGDKNFPIYFAAAYSQADIKRVFTKNTDPTFNGSMDYPGSYENIKGSTLTSDNKTFRTGTIFNSNKHTMEFVDTDLHEMLKLTHYSGSFKEFNNYATIEFATGNDQKMVIGDQFLTIQKNQSEYVRGHKESLTGGDHYINIGETKPEIVRQILTIHKDIHERKLLFDIQRAKYNERSPSTSSPLPVPQDMSPLQERRIASGTDTSLDTGWYPDEGFARCPICGNQKYDPYNFEEYGLGLNTIDQMWKQAPQNLKTCSEIFGISPVWNVDQLGNGCHSIKSNGRVQDNETVPPICSSIEHPFKDKRGYYAGMKCPCCNGDDKEIFYRPGYSPSSQNGKFQPEPIKEKGGPLDQLIAQFTPTLFDLEKQLGEGDEIKTVSMNKIETIGTVMNDLKSFRTDPIGKLKIDGCWVAPQKTFENLKPSPHVEYVDVADIPGGDYILTVMNKYKLLVGAKGINIMTHGPLDIYGTIVNFHGEQVNISSKNEVLIDGGERFAIRARKIALMPFEHNAVVVEGLLHVTRNVIIQGGLMLEGEVALLHVTCPIEWHETMPALYAPPASVTVESAGDSCIFTAPAQSNVLGSVFIPTIGTGFIVNLNLPKHTHWFKAIPTTFLPHSEAVRETMIEKGINSRQIIPHAASVTDVGNCNSTILYGEAYPNVAAKIAQAAWNRIKEANEAAGRSMSNDRYPGPKTTGRNQTWRYWDTQFNTTPPCGYGVPPGQTSEDNLCFPSGSAGFPLIPIQNNRCKLLTTSTDPIQKVEVTQSYVLAWREDDTETNWNKNKIYWTTAQCTAVVVLDPNDNYANNYIEGSINVVITESVGEV